MPLPHRSTLITTPHWYKLGPLLGPAFTPGLVLPQEHTAPFPISHPTVPHFSFFPVSKAIAPKHRQGRLWDVMRGNAAQHSQQPGTSAPNSLV